MSHSISTLLTRNLHDVFGENERHASVGSALDPDPRKYGDRDG